MSKTSQVLQLYRKLEKFPFGNKLFSFVFGLKAPYFRSISPTVLALAPGKAHVRMKQRWSVQNHIGTVHAIACCNLVEMAMGCCAEASIPSNLRWLPRGMDVAYVKKAKGTLTAVAEIPDNFFELPKYPGDVSMPVVVKDAQGDTVVTAKVHLYITEKPKI